MKRTKYVYSVSYQNFSCCCFYSSIKRQTGKSTSALLSLFFSVEACLHSMHSQRASREQAFYKCITSFLLYFNDQKRTIYILLLCFKLSVTRAKYVHQKLNSMQLNNSAVNDCFVKTLELARILRGMWLNQFIRKKKVHGCVLSVLLLAMGVKLIEKRSAIIKLAMFS